MVQQLFGDIEKLKAEVTRLRGRLDSITAGSQLINVGVQIPLPLEGAMIYGTSAPAWARIAPPASGDDYTLQFLDGDNKPSWHSVTGAGDDVFVINMAVALG